MAGRQSDSPGAVEEHPDFPAIFEQAREQVWGEFAPRYESAVTRGNLDAAERIQARVDERARQRAVRGVQALRNFDFDRHPAIAGLGEVDPNLTLDDVRSSAPDPQTLLGTGPAPRARGELLPVPLPDLPSRSPNAVEFGEGLQPQSGPEARELAQDASSAGQGALVTANVAAAHPIGRAVTAIPKVVAAAPRAAAALTGVAALTAGSADAQAPGRDTASSQAALDRLLGQQQTLTEQRTAITAERAKFTDLTTPAQIRAAQERLNALGYDAGPADGRPGGQWREALKKYNADRARELQDITTQLGGIGPQITDAQKQVRLDQTAAQREQGGNRLREMEENVPWYQQAWRDYGPYAGAVLGGLVGYGGRVKVGSAINERSRQTADRADDLMGSSRGGVPGRAARVNQFYTEGGGRPAPFTPTPGQRPYPYTSNPNAPAADTLYQPGARSRFGPGVALAGVGAGEAALGHVFAVAPAREELAAAQQAVSADPSEANIRRLQTARDKLAGAEALSNFGRGVMGGVGAAEVKSQLRYSPVRPNVSAAEQERAAVDMLLQKRAPRTSTPAPAPTAAERRAAARAAVPPNGASWNATAQRWQMPNGNFVAGAPPVGRSWRDYPDE